MNSAVGRSLFDSAFNAHWSVFGARRVGATDLDPAGGLAVRDSDRPDLGPNGLVVSLELAPFITRR